MSKVQSSSEVKSCNTIPSPELKQALNRVLFCTSKEICRYSLHVVRFISDGKNLKLEATDGRRISVATINTNLPEFQILVGVDQCKSIKKLCQRKRDSVTVETSEDKVVFSSSNGDEVEVAYTDQPERDFAPVEHVLGKEAESRIPILNPTVFKSAIRLALVARKDGDRVSKDDASGNLIHVISTPRRLTVYGKSRRNGNRSVTHLPSDDTSSLVNVAVNGSYLLDLLTKLPRNKPYELRHWDDGMTGIAVVTPDFNHRLCGITLKRGVSHV